MAHTTSCVVMVPPHDFAFNEQTGLDNEFQNKPTLELAELRKQVMAEYLNMVTQLNDAGVTVLQLEKNPALPETPDAVFPNNWFSTDSSGEITFYPMKTLNRQAEVRPQELTDLFRQHGFQVNYQTTFEADSGGILEGTGSIVFDHNSRIAFGAISERCDRQALMEFCQERDYLQLDFKTESSNKTPIYHTNVMLSIGESFAVICKDSVVEGFQKDILIEQLQASGKEVIEISLEQAEKSFCANILQLHNEQGERLIAMSQSAYQGFNESQLAILKRHGKIIACDIATIEQVGGGSVRCMLAENFLPLSE